MCIATTGMCTRENWIKIMFSWQGSNLCPYLSEPPPQKKKTPLDSGCFRPLVHTEHHGPAWFYFPFYALLPPIANPFLQISFTTRSKGYCIILPVSAINIVSYAYLMLRLRQPKYILARFILILASVASL